MLAFNNKIRLFKFKCHHNAPFLSTKCADFQNSCFSWIPSISSLLSSGSPRFKRVTHCIFDLDGTVVDSENQYHETLAEIIAKYGKKYDEELKRKNIGGTDEQIVANIVKHLNLHISEDMLLKEVLATTMETLPKSPMKKGAERLLNHLNRTGVLCALATNTMRPHVMKHAAAKPRVFKNFHHMVCLGDSKENRGKPYPDPYLLAASMFPDRPKPAKCLAFEDSTTGVEAAVAAGMQVVMTPGEHVSKNDTRKATVVLKSLDDFKPEDFGLQPFP